MCPYCIFSNVHYFYATVRSSDCISTLLTFYDTASVLDHSVIILCGRSELPIYALLSSFHLYLPLCAVHFMSFNMFYLGGEQLSVRWNLGIRGSSTYSQSIGRGRGFEPRNMMVNCMFSEHLLDLHIISRVCFSSYFHTNWRVYSLLDYAHIPSFANMCAVAWLHTDRQTHTHESDYCGHPFRVSGYFHSIIKDRPN